MAGELDGNDNNNDNNNSRRSSMSHHIVIETFPGGSARSSTVFGGGTQHLNNEPTPRADYARFNQSAYTIRNRSSMPAATLVEEDIDHDEENHQKQKENMSQRKEEEGKTSTTIRQRFLSLFQRYWFLLGLGLVIGLAWAFPQVGKSNGVIQAQYTVKWGAVIVIFLVSGLGIDVRVMLRTILRWRLHLVVQSINFLVLPFVMYGLLLLFIRAGAAIDAVVYKGWIIALSTSTTVSSNVVMTRNAKGNDSAGERFILAFLHLDHILITVFSAYCSTGECHIWQCVRDLCLSSAHV